MITRHSAFKFEYLKNQKRFLKTVKTLIKNILALWHLSPLKICKNYLKKTFKVFLEMLPIWSSKVFITSMHICYMPHSGFLFDDFLRFVLLIFVCLCFYWYAINLWYTCSFFLLLFLCFWYTWFHLLFLHKTGVTVN